MRVGNIGRYKAYEMLSELKAAGYVTMEQGLNGNGKFVNVRYLLYEEPLAENQEASTLAENQEACHGETTLPENPETYQILNKDSTKVNRSAIGCAAAPLPLTDELAGAEEYS